MVKYQNVAYGADKSALVEVGEKNSTTLGLKSRVAKVPTPAGSQAMVNGEVLLQRPKSVTGGDNVTADVNNSIRIAFTVIQGDTAALAAMRVEANRIFDEAIAFNIVDGLVPPVYATFEQA